MTETVRLSLGFRKGYGSVPTYYSLLRLAAEKFPGHQQVLSRSESMCTLSHKTLLGFVEANDVQGLRDFLTSRHIQVDDRDENGTTVLMVAASRGFSAIIRELVARGAEANAEDHDSWSALLFAARAGHLEALRTLLEHGANVEQRDMGGWTALIWASYKGHTECVALLLEAGADVHTRGNYNLGGLLWAAGRGHFEIVKLLVEHGAKVNVADKYGTTALVWACRKGNVEIVDILLKAGANVDTAGMYSWTPLLVATQGRHQEVVSRLLVHRPNVNALDKDGLTALAIACREGLQEIAVMLMAAGAYINLQDRAGDTQLIHAVKGGHRGVVEALLKKHADLDVPGKDRKTAIYTAVEKGHTGIAKLLLSANPDLEVPTKDGDTALLRAVRSRNVELVTLLLEKKAKVSAVDRKGDTCLHIAMRARSKAIVEVLLRNPKHSQLLYRPNRAGETPYNIDMHHPKTILGQIYGARRLNTNEDSEGMLGYDLYSSALADILSDPGLTMPIIVGLYAKWGSGKSFLLGKLKEEMKLFTRQWMEPVTGAPWVLLWLGAHIALIGGLAAGLGTNSWIWGSSVTLTLVFLVYFTHLALKVASNRYDCYWPYNLNVSVSRRLASLKLVLQVIFCHPPGPASSTASAAIPVKFYFADQTKGAGADGEGAIVHMLGSLFEVIESEYGVIATRLYRAFRPQPVKVSAGWRFRRVCCMPHVILFELGILGAMAGIAMGIVYFIDPSDRLDQSGLGVALISLGLVLSVGLIANLHSLARALGSLIFSQKRHLLRAVRQSDSLTALSEEVTIMSDMVKCLDAFTNQQSRLVGVVDALDSCDVEKIISMLNAVHQLLSEPSRPFIVLLAVDPHIIAKAVESQSRRVFTEGSIGGHDFLRNLVHLPVYLQNSGLRQAQRAQSTALAHRTRSTVDEGEGLTTSVSTRRLSSASEIMVSQEKLKPTHKGGSRKLRLSDSVASSIGSNLHRASLAPQGTGAPHWDLSKMLLSDDYFSDVNPRSMRRLMNVIYITGRLLKAFHIDFNWYRLCSWVNLTEQWPLRASMIVLQHDILGDQLDDNTSLRHIYDKVRHQVTSLREAAPLLELDRDDRKLDAFLTLHKGSLQVADLRVFLPFTINLDPYLRKVLKEDQQALEEEGLNIPFQSRNAISAPWKPTKPLSELPSYMSPPWNQSMPPRITQVMNAQVMPPAFGIPNQNSWWNDISTAPSVVQEPPVFVLPSDVPPCRLSTMSCDELERHMSLFDELKPVIPVVVPLLHQQCITGRVLSHCDLNELKSALKLSFGHWEVFRMFIESLRVMERNSGAPWNCPQPTGREETSSVHPKPKHNTIEKQVTLEEQTICGALQTLNEEALEDVLCGELPDGGSAEEKEIEEVVSIGVANGGWSAPNTPPNLRRDYSILKPSGSLKVNTGRHVSYEAKPNDKIEVVCEKNTTGPRPATLVVSCEKKNRKSGHAQPLENNRADFQDVVSDDELAPLVSPLAPPTLSRQPTK